MMIMLTNWLLLLMTFMLMKLLNILIHVMEEVQLEEFRYSGTSSISANVGQGRGTLATPDGRNAGTPLAEGCSPSHNMDQHGPTSVLKSVSKLPTDEIVGGVLLNQKVNPQTLAKEEDKLKLIALLRTFFNRLHGYHIQYNVVSRETLIDAQKHPEKNTET